MTPGGVFSPRGIRLPLKIQIGGNLNPSIVRLKKSNKEKEKKN
jgi:hypothetical protein